MSNSPTACPECGKSHIQFLEKRNEWICQDCIHRWSVAPAENESNSFQEQLQRIFLSYARADDEPFVRRLCYDLAAAGFKVWFDRESLMSRGLTFHQEIKDAIRCEADRIVYVGGPKAAASPYVREEWQLGLEFDHVVVTPILRLGDYDNDIPGELALLHCEDFREGVDYDKTLAKLIDNLQQPNPKLGALVAVPSLPPHFIARPELMRRVRDALLVDLQTSHVITSADTSDESHVGMQGMGGIGKSVLAAALARNRRVREAYPDGIVWISFGQTLTQEDLLSRLRDLVRHLGGDATFTSLPQGQGILRELLQAKAVLLILDDVWRAGDAKEFDFLGPRCRMLITTRDAGIVHTLHGERLPVSLFTEQEALHLLAEAVGIQSAELPPEAREVADECGLLPLALTLSGGMAKKRGGDFSSVLQRLRRADLDKIADRESINPMHETLWRAMQASVDVLTVDEQRRFAELAVFPEDETVPESTVATLWEHTGRLNDLDTEDLLINLAERSLIQLDTRTGADGTTHLRISLHDLLHDYAVRIADDAQTLNQSLISAYRAKCPDGWHTGPDDGYFYLHLRNHLTAAGRSSELADLLSNLQWLEAKNSAGLVLDLPRDFAAAVSALPTEDDRCQVLQLLNRALQRDIGFIDRHRSDYPQALFQHLWNFAWWHDAAEAMNHYDCESLAASEEDSGRLPAEAAPVSQLLQRWRENRMSQQYWIRSLRPPPEPLAGPMIRRFFAGDSVDDIALTTDGAAILAASGKRVVLWDIASGQLLRELLGHEETVTSVAISADGLKAASGSWDRTVRIWDTRSGNQLHCLRRHSRDVSAVAFKDDGCCLASASSDGTVVFWDVKLGDVLTHIKLPHDAPACEVTPEEWKAITDAETLESAFPWRPSFGSDHWAEVHRITWIPNTPQLLLASKDQTVRVWDFEERQELFCLSNKREIKDMATAMGGKAVVIADGGLRGSELENPKWVQVPVRVNALVTAVACAQNGERVGYRQFEDNRISIWDRIHGSLTRSFRGPAAPIKRLAFAPNGRDLLSCGVDGVRIWDTDAEGTALRLPGHAYGLSIHMAVAPDGGSFASGCSADSRVLLWDGASARLRGILQHEYSKYADDVTVWEVVYSPAGGRVMTACTDQSRRVWSTEDGTELLRISLEDKVWGCGVFSIDGTRIAFCSPKNTICLWDLVEQHELTRFRVDDSEITCLAFGNSPNIIACSSWHDFGITLWDVEAEKPLMRLLGHKHQIRSLAFSSDGRRLVSASFDGSVRVWDLDQQTELCVALAAKERIHEARFSADGDSVVFQSDGEVFVWEWKADPTCQRRQSFPGRTDLSLLAKGADRYPILAFSCQNETRFIDIRSRRTIASFLIKLSDLTGHPNGRVWGGVYWGDIYLLSLEGPPR